MAKKNLVLSLAKVIIAAAWADGEVVHDEINSLKDLLFHAADITATDWAELEIYIEAPVDAKERARLVEELKAALVTPADMRLALDALKSIIQADGEVTNDEQVVMEEIKNALQEVNVSIFGRIGRVLRGPVQRRSQTFADTPNRELHLEDFMKNKIFYEVRRRTEHGETAIDIPEPELRKLSLAGGLMARVASVDRKVTEGEHTAMVAALQDKWGLSEDQANLVVEVAVSENGKSLDDYRLGREFFKATTEKERERFLETLFVVAQGDGRISAHETEEIRTISKLLKMTHRQFIQAKTSLSRNNG